MPLGGWSIATLEGLVSGSVLSAVALVGLLVLAKRRAADMRSEWLAGAGLHAELCRNSSDPQS